MATIVGGIAVSHTPTIGFAYDNNKQSDPAWAPIFENFEPIRAWFKEKRPDALVYIFNDHVTSFFFDHYSVFALGIGDSYAVADEGGGRRALPAVSGNPKLAQHIGASLVMEEFDMSFFQGKPLDHGFFSPMSVLLERTGDEWPTTIIPLQIGVLQFPIPTAARCYKLGRALRRAIESFPDDIKVAVVATGGLSHQVHGERAGFNNPDWDHEFLDLIARDPERLAEMTHAEYARLGGWEGAEIIMWLAMRGALSANVRKVHSSYYLPSMTGIGTLILENESADLPAKVNERHRLRMAEQLDGAAALNGTHPFTLATSVKAYRLNSFLHRLIDVNHRKRFLADEEFVYAEADLTEEERILLRRRDWRGLIHYGVIFFLLEKLGAAVGVTNLHIYAAMRGESLDDFLKTRNTQVLYSVKGADPDRPADPIRVEFEDDVAVILIDNPPINAGSLAVRSGLLQAVLDTQADPGVRAMVIMGAGSTFIAGADLREFDLPLGEPQLPAVIAAIESCAKPVIAALHGAALGGGLELALGCDARIAVAGTVVGLPEVTLGVIPGAGGTQRLPRLTGIPKAIAMIASGERVAADEALSLGILDGIVTGDLRGAAVAWARNMQGRKARVRELAVTECNSDQVAKASAGALRAGKGRPAVRAAIHAVTSAATVPIEDALRAERTAFTSLRTSRDARALRYQFFAEREAAKQPTLDGVVPRALQKVGVVGAGTMGSGIAIAALDAGVDVVMVEREEVALKQGVDRIRAYYRDRVARGKLQAAESEQRMQRFQAGLDWSALSDADLVIEAVFEDLEVKQEVFRRLDEVVRPGAVLASNTSYTDLDAIALATSRPQDVVGLHFFSPAQVMRLLEVVRGAATSPEVLATSLQLARRLRKIPVVSANAFGFIGNRVYAAYRRQCEFMLEEGATPLQVDEVLETFGFAMGPFSVGDMSGLDIAWGMRRSLAATRDPTARYVQIPDMLCEAGRFGRKVGAGYYRYTKIDTPGQRHDDPVVLDMIQEARAAKGIEERRLDTEEIARRAVLAMLNEAALLLEEKVAQRASDIDIVLVNGYGFPKWEGGPVFWARERDADALAKELDYLEMLSGPGFVRGDVRYLLAKMTTQQ